MRNVVFSMILICLLSTVGSCVATQKETILAVASAVSYVDANVDRYDSLFVEFVDALPESQKSKALDEMASTRLQLHRQQVELRSCLSDHYDVERAKRLARDVLDGMHSILHLLRSYGMSLQQYDDEMSAISLRRDRLK